MAQMCPEVGEWVQYLPSGERTPNQAPAPACVAAASDGGVLSLLVYSRHGGESVRKPAVRHVDDPFYNKQPNLRAKNGAWQDIPLRSRPIWPRPEPPVSKDSKKLLPAEV